MSLASGAALPDVMMMGDRGPTISYQGSKFQAVDAVRHVDVGEDDADVEPTFQNADRRIRPFRLQSFKACVLDHVDGHQPKQRFILDDEYHSPGARIGLPPEASSETHWTKVVQANRPIPTNVTTCCRGCSIAQNLTAGV